MHDHQRVEAGGLGHRRLELGRLQVGELIDPGVQQEALEAEDARVVQRGEVRDVPRDGAAPEPDVDEDLVAGHGLLGPEPGERGRRGDRVERHVDDGGDAAGSGRAGRAGEALPLGASRLVDVHVGVDQAGDEHLVLAEDDDGVGGQVGIGPCHDGDPSVDHTDGCRPLDAVDDGALRAEQDVEGCFVIRHGAHDVASARAVPRRRPIFSSSGAGAVIDSAGLLASSVVVWTSAKPAARHARWVDG